MKKENLLDPEREFKITVQSAEQIETKEIDVGDQVYCSYLLEDVIVLELPEPEFISLYDYRAFPIRNVACQTLDGKIEKVSYLSFVKISRGNYYTEINIIGEELDSKNKLDFFEFLARGQGFRVDKIKKDKNITTLKIYGDSQKKVDKFLVNANFTYEVWKRE